MINHIEGTQRPVPTESETASDFYAKMPGNAVKSMLCSIWRVRKQNTLGVNAASALFDRNALQTCTEPTVFTSFHCQS